MDSQSTQSRTKPAQLLVMMPGEVNLKQRSGVYAFLHKTPLFLIIGLDGTKLIVADSFDRARLGFGLEVDEWGEPRASIDQLIARDTPDADAILKALPEGWLERQVQCMKERHDGSKEHRESA